MIMDGFDIESFLDKNDVAYKTKGSNVSVGWIEISCPFCNDPSYHLGINLESGLFHCWVCQSKGDFIALIKKLLNVNYERSLSLITEHKKSLRYSSRKERTEPKQSHPKPDLYKLLRSNPPTLVSPYTNYLIKRGFNPDELKSQYDIHFKGIADYFAYRIAIPIYLNKVLVNITARAITDRMEPKYSHLSNEDAIVPMKQLLYNIDNVENEGTVIICEGVFDVWRMGNCAVASFGTFMTDEQLLLLRQKNVDKAVVLYDSDAVDKADKLADTLSVFVPKVEVIEIDNGDPASASDLEIKEIRLKISM